ncbi:MAG: hypothetical protein ACTSRS_15880 [Candidatus Helarchaeota archaeon]
MPIKFADLSIEEQERFVEQLMEIKSHAERFVIEIIMKGSSIDIEPLIDYLQTRVKQLVQFLK